MAEPGRQIPADQIVGDQIVGKLTELGHRGASAAVEISGQPGGIVYLSNGRLAFAESPAVPDLGTRLVRSRRLAPDVWDQIARDSRPDGAVGAALVGRAHVTPAELQRLLQSIALDALLALTTPFAGECCVTRHLVRAAAITLGGNGPGHGRGVGGAVHRAHDTAASLVRRHPAMVPAVVRPGSTGGAREFRAADRRRPDRRADHGQRAGLAGRSFPARNDGVRRPSRAGGPVRTSRS